MSDYIAQPDSDYSHVEWRKSLIDETHPYPEHGWVRTVTYSPWRHATAQDLVVQGLEQYVNEETP